MKWASLAMVVGAIAFGCGSDDRGGGGGGGGGDCDPVCSGALECCTVAGTSICVYTPTDRNNCGGCGIVCPADQNCVSNECTGGGPGFDAGPPPPDSGMPMPGCTTAGVPMGTDGRSDPSFMSCCGMVCDATRASSCSRPMGMGRATCMCGAFLQCLAGETCAMSAGALRCVSTRSDPENCGTIGHRCAEGEVCSAGVCACG